MDFFEERMHEWIKEGKDGVAGVNGALDTDVRVVDLRPEEHSAEMLEWATETIEAAYAIVVNGQPGLEGLGMGERE